MRVIIFRNCFAFIYREGKAIRNDFAMRLNYCANIWLCSSVPARMVYKTRQMVVDKNQYIAGPDAKTFCGEMSQMKFWLQAGHYSPPIPLLVLFSTAHAFA